MTDERKQETINNLQTIVDGFIQTDEEPVLTMFGLISHYNQQYDNIELIGGEFARENGFNLT
jgi:hypothetical protein